MEIPEGMPSPVLTMVWIRFPDGTPGMVVSKHYNAFEPYDKVVTAIPEDMWQDTFDHAAHVMDVLREKEAHE